MLTIGQLAEQTGVATTTLRYYDELGLVRPAARAGGQRRYAEEARHDVGVVLLLRDLGFTLAEIARLLTDRPRRRVTWQSLARSKVDELDRLIDDAKTARTALVHALDCPKGDLAACPTFWSIVDARLDGRVIAERPDRSVRAQTRRPEGNAVARRANVSAASSRPKSRSAMS